MLSLVVSLSTLSLANMLDDHVKSEVEPKLEEPKAAGSATKRPIRVTTEAEREIIVRMALSGKNYKEIAEFLGLKPNTVYKFIRSRKTAWTAGETSAASLMRSPSASPKKSSARGKK